MRGFMAYIVAFAFAVGVFAGSLLTGSRGGEWTTSADSPLPGRVEYIGARPDGTVILKGEDGTIATIQYKLR